VTALKEEIPTASAATFVLASAARMPCLAGEVPTTSFALLLLDPMASSGLGHQSWNLVTGKAHMFMIKNCKLNLRDEFTCDPSTRVGEGSDDCPDIGCVTMGGCGKGIMPN
jgi:hypothetical protein